MTSLTKNFTLKEFSCPVGGEPTGELRANVERLAKNVQALRDHINKPVLIISGYRSPEYNKKIDGAKQSQHMFAKAADIKVRGMTPVEVYETVLSLIKQGKMEEGGLGLYGTFVHYDVRGVKARWFGTGITYP